MNIMAQSDYIHFKKTAMILKNDASSLPSVLSPEYYTEFASYHLETNVENTKNQYSRLVMDGNTNLFNMEKKVSSCPTFIMCSGTNARPNRVKNTAQLPMSIYRWKKTSAYVPPTCNFTVGNVTRKCLCSKTECRCRTTVYGAKS